MKKKVLIYIFLLFFLLIIFNSFRLLSYYFALKGKQEFKDANFTGAIESFSLSQKLSPSVEGDYNLGNVEYKKGDFAKARDFFEKALTGSVDDTNLNFKILHNLGNTYFFVGEKSTSIDDIKSNYEKSIDYYTQALKIFERQETRKNKEYVEQKLKDIENASKKQKQETPQNDDGKEKTSGSGSTNTDDNGESNFGKKSGKDESKSFGKTGVDANSEQGNAQAGSASGTTEQYRLHGNSGSLDLTPEESQTLENKKKELERFQKQNQSNFGIQQKQKDDFFDIFSSNPFFRDSFGENEKDW